MFGRMTLDRIQRVDLDAQWSEAQKQASHAVAQQAASQLGYKHFTQLVSLSNYKNQLHEALRELGIRPFNQADVQAYKERMVAKHTQGTTIASWVRTKLPQYNGIVPEFVLQTALDIKAKLPWPSSKSTGCTLVSTTRSSSSASVASTQGTGSGWRCGTRRSSRQRGASRCTAGKTPRASSSARRASTHSTTTTLSIYKTPKWMRKQVCRRVGTSTSAQGVV